MFLKSINSLVKHLAYFHQKFVTASEYWCNLCGYFMFSNPKSHSCFRSIQMYNMDFSKYSFALVISASIPKSIRKRLCRLTPIYRDFPSSEPNRTPPHLIFQDQTPQLASQVSSSQSYLTPASPSQQESVQSTFPSQVSLFEEINSQSSSAMQL